MKRLKWKLISGRLEIVLIMRLPMILLGYVGHVESCFGPFGDGVSVGAR